MRGAKSPSTQWRRETVTIATVGCTPGAHCVVLEPGIQGREVGQPTPHGRSNRLPDRNSRSLCECLVTTLSELLCQLCGHPAELDQTVVARHRIHLEADHAVLLQDHDHANNIASGEIIELGAAFHANRVRWT